MLIRILTAIVAILVLIPILVFSDTWLFPIAVGFFLFLAVFEIAGCVGMRKLLRFSIPTLTFTAIVSVFSGLYYKNVLHLEVLLPIIFAVGYIYLFYMFAVTMFSCGSIKFSKTAELVVMTIYAIIGFISVLALRGIGPDIAVDAQGYEAIVEKTGNMHISLFSLAHGQRIRVRTLLVFCLASTS